MSKIMVTIKVDEIIGDSKVFKHERSFGINRFKTAQFIADINEIIVKYQ